MEFIRKAKELFNRINTGISSRWFRFKSMILPAISGFSQNEEYARPLNREPDYKLLNWLQVQWMKIRQFSSVVDVIYAE